MSKYYKVEDVIRAIEEMHHCYNGWSDTYDKAQIIGVLEELPTIEVSEDNELKFYYVDSIDDYWIGQRLDNFYYAEWVDRIGFVWTHSRYLPWGEHVVDEQTLWKEHTYPSEPREIPFTEWIVGFMKKYGSKVSEDCISREWVYNKLTKVTAVTPTQIDMLSDFTDIIKNAPSVVPTTEQSSKVGEWENYKDEHRCSECGEVVIGDWYDDEWYDYCPNCGAKMKGADDED